MRNILMLALAALLIVTAGQGWSGELANIGEVTALDGNTFVSVLTLSGKSIFLGVWRLEGSELTLMDVVAVEGETKHLGTEAVFEVVNDGITIRR